MSDLSEKEGRAWRRLTTSAPRGQYEHASAYRRREYKHYAFRTRVKRDPTTGCWMWTGSVLEGKNGRRYPIFYHRRETTSNTTRAAFTWMMREWFPEVSIKQYTQTDTTCGRDLCINPFHRVRKVPNGDGITRMKPSTVLEIYALRDGPESSRAVAQRFGVHQTTVIRVWNGSKWSSVTGHRRGSEPPRRGKRTHDPDQIRRIYAERTSGKLQREVAQQYGVSEAAVRRIWKGQSWAEVTGHGLLGAQRV